MQSVLNENDFFDVFNNVLKTVNNLTNRDSKGKNNKPEYLGGSIARYTKNLTMSFPVLVDDGLSVETSQMISKANEKNIASMLEMLFASMSLNGKDGTTGKDILRRIHNNIDTMSMDDVIDVMNDYVANNENAYLPKLSESEIRDAARALTEALKMPQKRFPVNSFNEKSLNDYLCKDMYNGVMVYEAPYYDGYAMRYQKPGQANEVNDREKMNLDYDKHREQIRRNNASIENDRERLKNERDRIRADKERQVYMQNRDRENDRASLYRDGLDLNRRRVLDSDFKKANELQPTMMIVNFNIVDGDENHSTVVDRKSFVAGVKCRMIATSSLDIVERLLATNKTQVSFKNLIRATTGEIKLGRDFILAINQQKLDAKNDVKKGEAAKLWTTLKKRSVANNARKISRDKNDATAITTLVVSQETANYMATTGKFDISIAKNAKSIMDNYNLLCLVIADETAEVAKFLYDGNSEFESLSFNVLSREAQDKSYRKVVDLINAAGR